MIECTIVYHDVPCVGCRLGSPLTFFVSANARHHRSHPFCLSSISASSSGVTPSSDRMWFAIFRIWAASSHNSAASSPCKLANAAGFWRAARSRISLNLATILSWLGTSGISQEKTKNASKVSNNYLQTIQNIVGVRGTLTHQKWWHHSGTTLYILGNLEKRSCGIEFQKASVPGKKTRLHWYPRAGPQYWDLP